MAATPNLWDDEARLASTFQGTIFSTLPLISCCHSLESMFKVEILSITFTQSCVVQNERYCLYMIIESSLHSFVVFWMVKISKMQRYSASTFRKRF
jgi:hypothetical protein